MTVPSLTTLTQSPIWQRAFIMMMALVCSLVVLWYAWIAEDAFITMTYVRHLLEGHGPVYNLGERVQGYTHPLWFLLLIPSLAIVDEPILVASGLGATITFLTVAYIGLALFQHQARPIVAAALLAFLVVALSLTESWRSFQTSGLENSLTNFLIAVLVVELFREGGYRTVAVTLVCSLLALTRPDLALLVGPLGLFVAYRAFREGELVRLAAALTPALAWLVFAQLYYGSILPNTASAKLGMATLDQSLLDGLFYVVDWLYWEPASAFTALFLACVAMRTLRLTEQRTLLLGIVLYFGYVMLIGGDYMRARFLLPVFVGITYLGLFGLSQFLNSYAVGWQRMSWIAVALGAFMLLSFAAPTQAAQLNEAGIVAERLYYEGLSLRYYLAEDELDYKLEDVALVPALNEFAAACGQFSIHSGTVGALGYLSDSRVDVIDSIGLTDAYIASLDRSFQISQDYHRPGHPRRYIPLGYLASRKDIAIFTDWKSALADKDCSIIARAEAYVTSTELFNPRDPASGPSFSAVQAP